jgi:hypothetical protein
MGGAWQMTPDISRIRIIYHLLFNRGLLAILLLTRAESTGMIH